MQAALSLTDKKYKAKPLRRVYIDKKWKKAKRLLGILCMYDRAMQALYAMSLEPVAETTADTRSFEFRGGRCAQDVQTYIHTIFSRKFSAQWILEGDIKGCFDHINHDWLRDHICMDLSVLNQFLKAGYIFEEQLFATDEGTLQWGIISPILANMTLDGIESLLDEKLPKNQKIHLVRYADDFIVTANAKKLAEKAKKLIADFLKPRGLELSEEKIIITHIDDGFDFLGWNIRKYNGKYISKPSKKSIKSCKESLTEVVLRKGKAKTQDELISTLNPKIWGWANYHSTVYSKETFGEIDLHLYNILRKCGKHRHNNKSERWIKSKYWRRIGNRKEWFATDDKQLMFMVHVPIRRQPKLTLSMNPFIDQHYFETRKAILYKVMLDTVA